MGTRTSSVDIWVQSEISCRTGGWITHAVVAGGNFVELELKVPDEGDQNASDLEISKLRDS